MVLTAGLIAAQDPRHEPLANIVSDVLVTVAVFWLAHGYAHALGRPLEPAMIDTGTSLSAAGSSAPASSAPGSASRTRPARWSGFETARTALMANWPLARACLLPVLALVLARLAGASVDNAQEASLWTCVVLLTLWGYRAGHAAGLTRWRLARYTTGSALLGIILILLEVAIH
ncbi:conserved membrane hypothetical protein [Frankia canadensis]|uniref:Uncharacterized protein n=1 Tax=Frankia canadensis TaxID=1836972 RepID=A0A2I2KKV3_9ACTN|nr:hypothetical protein [Frankia canadensis]SNQ46298.1 conserved membrane hypothetical protein [Frankia canadensis]SOU53588.1 conserved membrane hypothetical protein [Frankia canadensis]